MTGKKKKTLKKVSLSEFCDQIVQLLVDNFPRRMPRFSLSDYESPGIFTLNLIFGDAEWDCDTRIDLRKHTNSNVSFSLNLRRILLSQTDPEDFVEKVFTPIVSQFAARLMRQLKPKVSIDEDGEIAALIAKFLSKGKECLNRELDFPGLQKLLCDCPAHLLVQIGRRYSGYSEYFSVGDVYPKETIRKICKELEGLRIDLAD
jgi:hypothetical protein